MRKSIIFFSLIFFVIAFCLFSNQKIIVLESDFIDPNQFLLRNNGTISEGVLRLFINDTEGLWSYSKAMRGMLPHRWDRYLSINQIEFRKNIEAEEGFIYLDIRAKANNYGFYNETESWVNLFVSFWFMVDESTYDDQNSSQLVVDIRLFGLQYKDGVARHVTEDIAFKGHVLGIDNDYHYLTSDNQFFLETDQYYEVTIDLGKQIKKAFNHFTIQKAKLMEIEIILEANYGYAEAEIDYIKVYVYPQANSAYVLYNSIIIFILSFILLSFIAYLIK